MMDIQDKALRIVFDYIKARLEKTDTHVTFGQDEVYVVWFSKTLQNWKCLISTTLPDGMYYEVTYDGDKRQAYIDAYKKFDNVTVCDPAFLTDGLPHCDGCYPMPHVHGMLCSTDCPTCGSDPTKISRIIEKVLTDG